MSLLNEALFSKGLNIQTQEGVFKKQTKALQDQKELHDLFFKNTAISVLIIDIEVSKFIDCNEMAVKILEYDSKEDILNLHPAELSPEYQPDRKLSSEKSEDMISLAIENGFHIFEWKHLKKTNKEFWVEVILTPIVLDGKKVVHVVWKDISDRKQSEAKLLEKTTRIEKLKERLELALLGSNNGVWDWNLLDNSVYFSPRWKEMIGYRDDELLNKFATWETLVYPGDIESIMLGIQKNIDGETEYYEGTHRLKHKDGHWVWILSRAKTQYDNGRAIRMIGTHTDITELKEKELKFTHQAQVIEQIHDSVISTDLNGIITSWNSGSERLLGYKLSEVQGQHITIIYPEEDYESFNKNLEILMQKGESHSTVRFVKKSHEIINADLSFSLLRDERGSSIGIIGYAQDITERKKAEEALEKQSRMAQMGEMISMIAHQWRQPLNAISLTSSNLQLKLELEKFDLKTKEEREEENRYIFNNLTNINSYVNDLSVTIDDFRDFFKPNKKSLSIKLGDVISKSINLVKQSFITYSIEVIEEENAKDEIELYDSEMMHVLLNILKNAEDNFRENETKNPKVIIRIQNRIIYICDNGGGVSEEVIDKIFDPYFSTKDEKNGTGLGLYMSKIIIEEHHNGELTVKNIDDGACFIIKLGTIL